MKISKSQLRQIIKEALEVHLMPDNFDDMNLEEAYGAGYYAGKDGAVLAERGSDPSLPALPPGSKTKGASGNEGKSSFEGDTPEETLRKAKAGQLHTGEKGMPTGGSSGVVDDKSVSISIEVGNN